MSTYPAWAAGQRITGAGLRASLPEFITKTTDESVTNSTVLQADDHLQAAVEAGATYTFELQLFMGAGDSNGDVKFGWDLPAGSTLHFAGTGAHTVAITTGTNGPVEFFAIRNATAASVLGFGISSGANTWVKLEGIVTVTTAGLLRLMWAQNVATATATRVLAGSWMELRRRA
ncbi:hypothetical protein [Streptomyces rubellomurinus]|uniref:Uncharacterized protein n=1 Tax=Streptomyces rubellomurinus (strain ATCC 31215) TaxID=359131 RepID=A0A0F2TBS5_STRR3|nr:hypothetical protein [Streptomyces rubellomurinus]KJS60653.1 hypothetical protein VM95_19720 [Streptomyces rubellomurinus]